jgi:hypothetical protein
MILENLKIQIIDKIKPETVCSFNPQLLFRLFLFAMAGLLLSGIPDSAQSMTTLFPGDTFLFTAPDKVDGGCIESNTIIGSIGANCGTSSPPTIPLSGFVDASLRFRRASYNLFQYNDFVIDGELRPDSLLPVQISGSANVRGFLAIVGVGQASANVVLKLLDITDGPEAAIAVKTYKISSFNLEGTINPSYGLQIKIEGGAPYIGVGGGNAIAFSLKAGKKIVRDRVDFGFDALLRRGRTYRLQLESTGFVKLGALPGLALASFGSLFETIPNVIDRNFWLNALGSVELPDIPVINLPPDKSILPWSTADLLIPTPPCPEREDKSEPYECAITDVLDYFNIPTSIGEIIDRIEARREQLIQDDVTGEDVLNRVLGGSPGVELTQLSVDIQEDQFEQLDRIEKKQIEENLEAGKMIVSLILPEAHGGQLETVITLVETLIRQSKEAGFSGRKAAIFLNRAEDAYNDGRYEKSFFFLSTAYNSILYKDKPRKWHDDN